MWTKANHMMSVNRFVTISLLLALISFCGCSKWMGISVHLKPNVADDAFVSEFTEFMKSIGFTDVENLDSEIRFETSDHLPAVFHLQTEQAPAGFDLGTSGGPSSKFSQAERKKIEKIAIWFLDRAQHVQSGMISSEACSASVRGRFERAIPNPR